MSRISLVWEAVRKRAFESRRAGQCVSRYVRNRNLNQLLDLS